MALRKLALVLAGVTAVAIGAELSAAQSGQQPPAAPPGPGLALINERCGFCHPPQQVLGVRKTPAQWAAVVQGMIDRGAELDTEEQKTVVDYLAANNAAPAG